MSILVNKTTSYVRITDYTVLLSSVLVSAGASCGFPFVEGEEYLVYSSNAVTVSLCSRTRSMSEADEDLASLGEGRSPRVGTVGPTPDVPDSEGRGGGCGLGSQAADMSLVGLMVGVVWLGIRRRQL